MTRLVGEVAAFLGRCVRLVLLLLELVLALLPATMIFVGCWLYDPRVALIGVGGLLYFSRPKDRRKT